MLALVYMKDSPKSLSKVHSHWWWLCRKIEFCTWKFALSVGRLNGVINLVMVFEELFHVTSPFCSHDKMNQEIRLFHEHELSCPDVVVCSSRRAHEAPIPYMPHLRRVSGFHLFAQWIFLFVARTHVTIV